MAEVRRSFEMKIKSWKVGQIMHDMSKYDDWFSIDVKGHEWGHDYKEYEDEAGFVTITNIYEIVKETEKAMLLDIDGFKTWVPKSAIA